MGHLIFTHLLKKKNGAITKSVQLIGVIILCVAFLLLLYFIFKENLAKLLISDYT